jgi:hypothetical protein
MEIFGFGWDEEAGECLDAKTEEDMHYNRCMTMYLERVDYDPRWPLALQAPCSIHRLRSAQLGCCCLAAEGAISLCERMSPGCGNRGCLWGLLGYVCVMGEEYVLWRMHSG